MNYEQFLKEKEFYLNKGYSNLANNNIYSYYNKDIIYEENSGHKNGKVYRCHLVEDWLNYYGLDETHKEFIGVSTGVRNSLELLSEKLKNKKWIIPSDVYPVYQQIIEKNNLQINTYKTLNNNLFEFLSNCDDDILLITDPLKPLGVQLSESNYELVTNWLEKDKARLLIVDSVYLLDNKINSILLSLYFKTNQVIILNSLSKSWLLPNCFGISLLPRNELGKSLREDYKILPKNEKNIQLAYAALNNYKKRPLEIKENIIFNIDEVNKKYNLNLKVDKNNPSYLFYNENTWDYWLNKNILTIPASVFGSNNSGTIISVLI